MQNGYGVLKVHPKPPSPAGKYLSQLEELGRTALRNPDIRVRRQQLSTRLREAGVVDLPPFPGTEEVVIDLMSFYFMGSQANDYAYGAAIARDGCRGLHGSEKVPPSLH